LKSLSLLSKKPSLSPGAFPYLDDTIFFHGLSLQDCPAPQKKEYGPRSLNPFSERQVTDDSSLSE